MAKLKSLLKVEGTLDGLTFYKTVDGYMVRTKGGVSKSRIENDPAFARTRENGKEFGRTAQSGKVLRNAIRPMLLQAKDKRVTSRLVKVLTAVKNLDNSNLRGDRTIAGGLLSDAGKQAVTGFDFNGQSVLGSILYAPYVLDTAAGSLGMADFVASRDIVPPQGATHVSISLGIAGIDFETGASELRQSTEYVVAVGETSGVAVDLTPASFTTAHPITLYLLLLRFSQEVNMVLYPLNNESYNVLHLLQVE